MRKLLPLFAIALTMSSSSAFAHGIWVAQRLDKLAAQRFTPDAWTRLQDPFPSWQTA